MSPDALPYIIAGFGAGIGWFLGVVLTLFVRWRKAKGEFKPCVIYWEEMRLTEMILEDTTVVWVPWGSPVIKGHAVDCGYSTDGRLVSIKIWDDVRFRNGKARYLVMPTGWK